MDSSGYPNMYGPGDQPAGAEHTRTMSDDSDDLQQDTPRSRTIFDSSCSTCDISVVQSKFRPHPGPCRSLKPQFNAVTCSEKHSRKPQTLAEQYWACAIPDALPPRPDRTSPRWDPNKEYQDLLDYTYPLNPKYFIPKDSEEAEAFLQDSGVDLDSYNASCDSKFGSFTSTYREAPRARRDGRADQHTLPFAFSTPLLKRTDCLGLQNPHGSSNGTFCGEFSPYASKLDFGQGVASALSPARYNGLDNVFSEDETSGDCSHRSGQFLPTTRVLPLHKDWDTDEEYLPLPPSLKELETLATHVKDLSITIGDREQGAKTKSRVSEEGPDGRKSTSDFLKYEESKIHRFSSLRDLLDGRASSEVLEICGGASLKENKSLVQRIQRFCRHLDKLIEWLYIVAEVTDKWTAPTPNVESIQLALNLYLKLKKDVAEQQVLANTVVKDGESLVRSLTLNSSVLKDTLSLISKQSGELDRHTERLYASVLEAMETITEESLARNRNRKQDVSLEMESH